jgi:hypothetical protein
MATRKIDIWKHYGVRDVEARDKEDLRHYFLSPATSKDPVLALGNYPPKNQDRFEQLFRVCLNQKILEPRNRVFDGLVVESTHKDGGILYFAGLSYSGPKNPLSLELHIREHFAKRDSGYPILKSLRDVCLIGMHQNSETEIHARLVSGGRYLSQMLRKLGFEQLDTHDEEDLWFYAERNDLDDRVFS